MRKKQTTKQNKQKKTTTDIDVNSGKSSLAFDIMQLFFMVTAVFFLLSLLSYSTNDPSGFTTVIGKDSPHFDNLFGNVGAWTAALLGGVFGWASLLLPLLFCYVSVLLYRYKKGLAFLYTPFLAFVYGLCIILCLSILSGLIGGFDIFFDKQPAGGLLGVIGSTYAASFIGKVGGIIIFLALILAFMMLLFSLTFSDMGSMISAAGRKISSLFSKLKGNKKDNDDDFEEETEEIEETPAKDDIQEELPATVAEAEEEKPITFADSQEDKDIFGYNNENLESVLEKTDDVPAYTDVKTEEELPQKEDESIIFDEDDEEISQTENDEAKDEISQIEIKAAVETEKVKCSEYTVPLSLLAEPDKSTPQDSDEEVFAKGELLVEKLKDFGVNGKVRDIQRGPVVTMFEYEPAPGTRVSKITTLDNDLALSMSALSVRIIAPIPGTNAVGIEMPNKHRATVFLKELFQSPDFVKNTKPLAVAIGKDAIGRPYMADIAKMPHLLVAGTTGSGKSVALNVMICSILFRTAPDMVKFIMIDPKAVELSIYDGIPHMLAPVVTDPKLASSVLKNIAAEMDRRYDLLKEMEVRNIENYNEAIVKEGGQAIPYIVVIVDEFADLIMVAGKEVEGSIIRIAQKARAAGIHLIIATQRPDSNVITGLIKSNMPARLALRVSQKMNSRIILDQHGAETLLGRGDSLFLPPGSSDLVRVHGAFVSDEEVRDIVRHLKTLGEPEYDMSMVKEDVESSGGFADEDDDPEYAKALEFAYEKGAVSISSLQRYLRIGYNRAARIVETMETRGVIAPSDGTAKPRQVIR